MTDGTPDDGEATVSLSVSTLGNGSAMDKAAETTQLDERRIATDVGRGIVPPYDPVVLASFTELNETHAACIRKKARYEVGYGFDIVAHPSADDPDPDGEAHQTVSEFWHGTESRWQTGPEGTAAATPSEVLELARQDYHAVGWAALEVLVDGEGTPVGLAHVPATTVRVRKTETETEDGETVVTSGHGYVQIRQGRRRYFGEAGDRYDDDPRFVDMETGDVASSADELPNGPANELIFLPNPSPLSLYYGIPDWVSAMQTMAADQAAKEWNHDIFDNHGIPHYAIKVTGGTLTEDSRDQLRELQDNLKGESYRTAVLEVDEFETEDENPLDTEDGSDVSIEFEPIGANDVNDMEFETFREQAEHDIAKVHEVPPILYNRIGNSNRSNSKEQVREFAEDVIAPEQAKFESRLYQIIHQTALGVEDWTIAFELRGTDSGEDAKVARDRVNAVESAVTVNEAREAAGWGPLPEGHPVDGETLLSNLGPDGGDAVPDDEDRPDDAPPVENRIDTREWSAVKSDLATKEPIEQTQFSSSNLDEGLYDFEDRELYVSFERDDGQNSLYAYVDVPAAVWSALANAGSHGSYHYDNIRLEYGYIEITNFHDRLPEGPAPDPGEEPDDIPM